MLCLHVKKNEPIRIGDDITVMVLAGIGNVKLGITAPRNVQIVRSDAVDQTPRERSDFEDDQISAPRAKAMARQMETLQRSIEYLRCENAELRAKLQDKEHVE